MAMQSKMCIKPWFLCPLCLSFSFSTSVSPPNNIFVAHSASLIRFSFDKFARRFFAFCLLFPLLLFLYKLNTQSDSLLTVFEVVWYDLRWFNTHTKNECKDFAIVWVEWKDSLRKLKVNSTLKIENRFHALEKWKNNRNQKKEKIASKNAQTERAPLCIAKQWRRKYYRKLSIRSERVLTSNEPKLQERKITFSKAWQSNYD